MTATTKAVDAVRAALQSDDVPPHDTKDRALWRVRFVLATMYDLEPAETGEADDTPLTDLLADLLHWCEAEDIDIHGAIGAAEWTVQSELKEWEARS